MKDVVKILTDLNKTVSCMESCTGGYIANEITNCEGASAVIKFSAVTYSNEYKIKMGVSKEVIDKYTVYSQQTAQAMAYSISNYAHSNYGIGITGKLNRIDKRNLYGDDSIVYVSIYDRDKDKYNNLKVVAQKVSREKNKEYICNLIVKKFKEISKN